VETRAYLSRALNALTARTPAYASRVDMGNSAQIYAANLQVRNGLRSVFLYPDDPESGPKPWPRFALWGKGGRLYVHATMLLTFLGTPVGGNEKISSDRLKQGLRALRFAIDEVKTGQPAKSQEKLSERWCISPAGFALDPECDPQPGLESAEELKVGDLVQWESQGVLQFPAPEPICGLSADGRYAYFDCTKAGIPVNQLKPA
jgi:hypothetical protein